MFKYKQKAAFTYNIVHCSALQKGKCYCQCRSHWQIEACKAIFSSGPNPNPSTGKKLHIYSNRQHYTSSSAKSIIGIGAQSTLAESFLYNFTQKSGQKLRI